MKKIKLNLTTIDQHGNVEVTPGFDSLVEIIEHLHGLTTPIMVFTVNSQQFDMTMQEVEAELKGQENG